jgi:hypothetical protein
MLEYWVAPLPLFTFPSGTPPLYAWLARQPRGVIVELPLPRLEALPGADARFTYMSIFHWMPMMNGYSGYYPPSYVQLLVRLRQFPAAPSVEALWWYRVRYLIVHTYFYAPDQAEAVLFELARNSSLAPLGRFCDGLGEAVVYRFR